jgi:hypothetical protein
MRRLPPAPWSIALALASAVGAGCADLFHNDRSDPVALARTLAAPGPPGPLAVAVALGCPAEEDGQLSACERCRVDSALSAYRRGEVSAVILSGGAAHNRFIEAEVMGQALLAGGVPPGSVFFEPLALTTWTNLRHAQRIMRQHGMQTALLISTAAHLPRVRRFAEWYGIAARYRACDRDEPAAAAGTAPAASGAQPSAVAGARGMDPAGASTGALP